MWDFDAEYEAELDLGARRKPVQWVAFAPPVTERVRQQVHKRYGDSGCHAKPIINDFVYQTRLQFAEDTQK